MNWDEIYFKPYFIYNYYERQDEIEVIDNMFRPDDQESCRNPRLTSFKHSMRLAKTFIDQSIQRKKGKELGGRVVQIGRFEEQELGMSG